MDRIKNYRQGAQIAFALKFLLAIAITRFSDFVPDEHWQSTEVAYFLHFGRGHLTWEWYANIRSYIPPLIILIVYKIASVFNCDGSFVILVKVPQVLQLALSAVGWNYFSRFASARVGSNAGKLATIFMLVSWFTTFCGARLISNQTEMSLNCIALYLFEIGDLTKFSFIMGLNFALRPTAAILWLPFLPEFCGKLKDKTFKNLLKCLKFAALPLVGALALDSIMTSSLSITWLEFFKFNFLSGGSAEFGVHSPYWYLYSGLPSVLGPLLAFLPFGYFCSKKTRLLTIYATFYIVVYSFIPHKEIRFLLPVTPLLFPICASVVSTLIKKGVQTNKIDGHFGTYLKFAVKLFIGLNLGATIFLGFFHQCGVKRATADISEKISQMDAPRVWIMTPCYAVPIFSHIHHPNIELEYYKCAPKEFRHLYTNGSAYPLIQPNGFATVDLHQDISKKLAGAKAPHFILAFQEHVPKIIASFDKAGYEYKVCVTYFHSFIKDFARAVEILCNS
ncbi:unnamed protein product [Orchesella dallaii]|uniref:Mannosyltransferase n=2 Tax=Orchesella dallaii TaxID=48710 RepID=A0ABP1RCE7_9HEXA